MALPWIRSFFVLCMVMDNGRMFNAETTRKCDVKIPKVCDFIIVGAGAAGATIAGRLSENKQFIVCLFEAGIEDTDADISPIIETPRLWPNLLRGPITYNFSTVPQKGLNGRTMFAGMGKVLGGSTSHNTMAFYRGFKADYDYWAAHGAKGWSYNDVLPYFLKLEDYLSERFRNSGYHSICGPFGVSLDKDVRNTPLYKLLSSLAKENGIQEVDCNEPSPFGMCSVLRAIRNGKRESTSTAYLRPAAGRPNLFIITEALVEKILISKYPKKAYGVQYSINGRRHQVRVRKEVIVSGGTYGSVQLLQLSGVGPKQLLRKLNKRLIKDLPVGYNLQDHLGFRFEIMRDGPVATPTADLLNDPEVLAEYVFKRTGKLAITSEATTALFIDTINQTLNWPEAQVIFFESSGIPLTNPLPRNSTTMIIEVLHPKDRGIVYIRSNYPNDPPIIDGRYYQNPADIKTLIDSIRKIQELTKSPSLKALNAAVVPASVSDSCRNLKPDSDEQWECLFRNSAFLSPHPVGTCKMGNVTDKTTVVDTELRVHGIKGLRVADASIMPEITSANTMAPSIMIGEKAADMIMNDY